ncbi:hypothetical protein B0H63DRAFT_68900 [Podospora didyma]|uniref:Fungal STAND N-terminal Goodbye domain-containing protein n=1 Tax=Podospora didyma TaxID=330526 RepID=A0AAE0K1Z6_9PEZI|nr:hypothetical protein B0H63DRAFT_68900 [Podospora didyma]
MASSQLQAAPATDIDELATLWQAALDNYAADTGAQIQKYNKPVRDLDGIISWVRGEKVKFADFRNHGSYKLVRYRKWVKECLEGLTRVSKTVGHAAKLSFPPAEAICSAFDRLRPDYDTTVSFWRGFDSYLVELGLSPVQALRVPELQIVISKIFAEILLLSKTWTKHMKWGPTWGANQESSEMLCFTGSGSAFVVRGFQLPRHSRQSQYSQLCDSTVSMRI